MGSRLATMLLEVARMHYFKRLRARYIHGAGAMRVRLTTDLSTGLYASGSMAVRLSTHLKARLAGGAAMAVTLYRGAWIRDIRLSGGASARVGLLRTVYLRGRPMTAGAAMFAHVRVAEIKKLSARMTGEGGFGKKLGLTLKKAKKTKKAD